jgi:hypothetical protein
MASNAGFFGRVQLAQYVPVIRRRVAVEISNRCPFTPMQQHVHARQVVVISFLARKSANAIIYSACARSAAAIQTASITFSMRCFAPSLS